MSWLTLIGGIIIGMIIAALALWWFVGEKFRQWFQF